MENKNLRCNICKINQNTIFIIIKLNDFYNYIKVFDNSIIHIFDYVFQNLIEQITYYNNN